MRWIGGAIQCALKESDMSRADGAMSGYAALTRPTELKLLANQEFNRHTDEKKF